MAIARYNIDLIRNGQKVADLSGCKDFSYSYGLNQVKEAKLNLTLNDSEIDTFLNRSLQVGSEIEIRRNDLLFWSGIITEITDNLNNITAQLDIEIVAMQHGYRLDKRRYTKQAKMSTDEWIKDMIKTTQKETFGVNDLNQVDLGFTFGDVDLTVDIAKTYNKDEILKSIQQITQLQSGGLDFVIGNTPLRNLDSQKKEISIYEKLGQVRPVTFSSIENGSIARVQKISSIKNYANRITAVGKDGIETTEFTLENVDIFQVQEDVISLSDISQIDTLRSRNKKELAIRSQPEEVYKFELVPNEGQFGKYECGDLVRFEVLTNRINIIDLYRVYTITVSVDKNGMEKVDLVSSKEEPSQTAINRAKGAVGLVENIAENFKQLKNRTFNLEK